MNESKIRDAFERVNTTDEMDKKMLADIFANQSGEEHRPSKSRKQKRRQQYMALAAALIITLFAVFQIPQVATYAETVLDGFKKIFYIQGEEVELEGEYVDISERASKHWKKYDSLQEVEEELGIHLLKYDDCSEDQLSWSYYPDEVENKIFSMTLTNRYYILGDLKNVKITAHADAMTGNGITFESGKKYKTPISCQIIFKTMAQGEKENADTDEEIVDDYGENWGERYRCKNLDTEVLIYGVDSDGPIAWDQTTVREMTSMIIVYEGIEYNFFGEVNIDTMKEIADKLHY